MKYMLLTALLAVSFSAFSQVSVGGYGSLVLADHYTNQSPKFENKLKAGLNLGVQGEFFRQSNFTLVVGMAYCQKGSRQEWLVTSEENPEGAAETTTIYMNYDYFSLSALGKYRYPVNRWAPFAVVGPRIDAFLTDKRSTPNVSPFVQRGLLFGVTAGLGCEYNFNSWQVFIRGAYQHDFVPFSSGGRFYNQAFVIDMGVAFEL